MRKQYMIMAMIALGLGASGVYSVGCRDADTSQHGGHEDHRDDDFERGPHGGRLLSAGEFAIEVTIYESGVPPQFRVYAYDAGKPSALDDIELKIELHRLGGRVDQVSFQKEGDYLLGDRVVEEPHSFDVKVTAKSDGKTHSWQYASYETRVVLSAQAALKAGIEVQEAGGQRIAQTIKLQGSIVLNADEVAHIVPRVSGQVREVRVHLGDQVHAGDVVAVIDSRELAEAKAGVLAAGAKLSHSAIIFDRMKKLFEKKIATEEELLEAKHELHEAEIERRTTEAKLHALGFSEIQIRQLREEQDVDYSRYEIKAPFGGVVIEKHLTQGEVVGPKSDVLVLADLTTVWVDLAVYQKDVAKIRLGQKVTVAFGGEIPDANGVIDYIAPLVDEATRTATARVVLDNSSGKLRPGLFVTARLVEHEAAVPIAIAAEAILEIRGWSVVFVNYGDTYEARPLEMGRSDGYWVEVTQGLSPGEKYVAKNGFVLKAEIGKSGATHAH